MAFCRHLDPPARLEFLQRRRNQLADKLARGPKASARDRYTRALIEHETTTAERDLEWVDSLIAAERGPSPVNTETV